MRTYLKKGTIIQLDSLDYYMITCERPIGEGGGSILYSASRLCYDTASDSFIPANGIDYALNILQNKQCIYLFLSPDSRYLYMQTFDNRLIGYDLQTKSIVMDFETISTIKQHRFLQNGDRLFLYYVNGMNDYGTYGYKRSASEHYAEYTWLGNTFIFSDRQVYTCENNVIYITPVRTLDDLCKMADDIIQK